MFDVLLPLGQTFFHLFRDNGSFQHGFNDVRSTILAGQCNRLFLCRGPKQSGKRRGIFFFCRLLLLCLPCALCSLFFAHQQFFGKMLNFKMFQCQQFFFFFFFFVAHFHVLVLVLLLVVVFFGLGFFHTHQTTQRSTQPFTHFNGVPLFHHLQQNGTTGGTA